VAGATVRLRDAYDQSKVIAQGLTDASGSVTLPSVAEAPYVLEVSADKHVTYRNSFPVVAGITNQGSVFIDRQTITYTGKWCLPRSRIATASSSSPTTRSTASPRWTTLSPGRRSRR
jgi:histidinol dehydrogenase